MDALRFASLNFSQCVLSRFLRIITKILFFSPLSQVRARHSETTERKYFQNMVIEAQSSNLFRSFSFLSNSRSKTVNSFQHDVPYSLFDTSQHDIRCFIEIVYNKDIAQSMRIVYPRRFIGSFWRRVKYSKHWEVKTKEMTRKFSNVYCIQFAKIYNV